MNIQDYQQTLARLITINDKEYPYKKIDGQYKTYCPFCQKYTTLSPTQFKEVRAKKECPLCGNGFNNTTRTHLHKIYYDGVYLVEDGMEVGYHINSSWTFGEDVKLTRIDKYSYKENGNTYVKQGYYISGMYYNYRVGCDTRNVKEKWRKTSSRNYYDCSWDYYTKWTYDYGTRKDKAKILADIYGVTKSNQIKFITEHDLNSELAIGVGLFDINSYDDYLKYEKYLKDNQTHLSDFKTSNIRLNIHYLDYLNRNNIDLGMYYVFLNDLKQLKFKYEKPTDFAFRAETVAKMVETDKDKEINHMIMDRFNSLPKYECDNIRIKPFSTAHEIRRCGKVLHCCIGGFVDDYATKKTDIYHLDLDGAIKIAIEIKKGSLHQARADHNSTCPANLLEHIKSFCNSNGFSFKTFDAERRY